MQAKAFAFGNLIQYFTAVAVQIDTELPVCIPDNVRALCLADSAFVGKKPCQALVRNSDEFGLCTPYACTDYIETHIPNIYLEDGDVVITSSTHISWVRIGHAGLVTDGSLESLPVQNLVIIVGEVAVKVFVQLDFTVRRLNAFYCPRLKNVLKFTVLRLKDLRNNALFQAYMGV